MDALNNEELVAKSLEEWKRLSAEEKKVWNAKARKEGQEGETNMDTHESKMKDVKENYADRKVTETLREVNENRTQNTISAKSKLASFAFKKA